MAFITSSRNILSLCGLFIIIITLNHDCKWYQKQRFYFKHGVYSSEEMFGYQLKFHIYFCFSMSLLFFATGHNQTIYTVMRETKEYRRGGAYLCVIWRFQGNQLGYDRPCTAAYECWSINKIESGNRRTDGDMQSDAVIIIHDERNSRPR